MVIVVFAWLNACFDNFLIKERAGVNHTLEAVIRGIVIGVISLFSDHFVPQFILNASVFWIVFELSLNLLLGQKPLFVGTTSKIDKITRRLFPDNTGAYLLAIKLIILCVSIIWLTSV